MDRRWHQVISWPNVWLVISEVLGHSAVGDFTGYVWDIYLWYEFESYLLTITADDEGEVKLKRRFGLLYCVAILVGFVIGSGIYIAPAGVMRRVPSSGVALILWTIAGVIGMLGALTNAELGTTYPTSGDKYVYMQEFYGDFLGFLYLWQYLLVGRPGANTIKCLIFAQWVNTLGPE